MQKNIYNNQHTRGVKKCYPRQVHKKMIREFMREYGDSVYALAHDGCHKMYLLFSPAEAAESAQWGYKIELISDMKNPSKRIFDIWSGYRESCGLQFIQVPSMGYAVVVPQ